MNRLAIILILIAVFSLPSAVLCQGLVMEGHAYDTIARLFPPAGIKDANLPVSVDLSAFCPEVRNQGEIHSCVGWAVGYGAMTIRQAIEQGWTDKRRITSRAYSALFIYNQIRQGSCRAGARISDALELLSQQGDCLASEFDQDVEDCERQPEEQLLHKASQHTIADYLALFDADAPVREKVHQIKYALAQQQPVIVGLSTRRNFYELKKAKYWWPDIGNTTPAGGHALVVVGYDEASASFLLFNSWGKGWGNEGFIRVKYEDFGPYCKYAFVLNTGNRASAEEVALDPKLLPSGLKMEAGASIRYLEGANRNNQPLFSKAPVVGEGGVYTTTQKSWTVGQLFQLEATSRQQGWYLYVFSVDPNANLHIHWPKNEKQGLYPYENTEKVKVPGPDRALKLANAGEDMLYIFFAARPVRHLRFIGEKMRFSRGAHLERLRAIMGRHLIPSADIHYETESLHFEANTYSEGYIVPMAIRLQTRHVE